MCAKVKSLDSKLLPAVTQVQHALLQQAYNSSTVQSYVHPSKLMMLSPCDCPGSWMLSLAVWINGAVGSNSIPVRM